MKKKNITLTAIVITIIAVVIKLIGLIKELFLSYFYGTSYIADAYLLTISMPVIFFGWLSSVALAYVPMYTKQANKERSSYTNQLKLWIFILSCICVLVGEIAAPVFVKLCSPGLDIESYSLAVEFFRVAILSLLFMPVTEINVAYLNCNEHYVWSNIINLFFGSTQVFFIIYSGLFNYHSLVWGYTVSAATRMLASELLCMRLGLKPSIKFNFGNNVKQTFHLGIPMIVSQLVAQINSLVDRALASFLSSGSISVLSYGNTLKNFAYSVFTLAADTIVFPVVSVCTANYDYKKLYDIELMVRKIMRFILLPITIFCCFNADNIVFIVFYRGAFTLDSLDSTAQTFVAYIIGLYPIALTEIIIRLYYALDDSKTPLFISFFSIAINAIMSYIAMRFLGVAGIALATSIASFATLPVYIKVLNKKIHSLYKGNDFPSKENNFVCIIKFFIALAVMTVVLMVLPRDIKQDSTIISALLSLCINFVASFVVFIIVCFLLQMDEISLIKEYIFKRRK